MLPLILEILFKSTKRSRLRQMMRGYRVLKKSGRLNRVALLKEELTEATLPLKPTDFSCHILGVGAQYGEVIVRQYLLIRVGGHSFNSALLRSLGKENGKVVFPLPNEWQKIIRQHGFEVDILKSKILWQLYILGALLYGSLKALNIILAGLLSISLKSVEPKKYVYFSMLSLVNLPRRLCQGKSYDVVSWYLQWEDKVKDVAVICHDAPNVLDQEIGGVEIHSQSEPLPSLTSIRSNLKYFYWCFFAILWACFDCVRGRWWHAFLLNQAAISAQVRCLEKKALALDYLFNNSSPIYRPLWTYEVEKLGSKVIFYFYSTNSENFKISESETAIPYGWKAMTWPYFLVWDKWHEEFIRKSIGFEARVDIVGPIWFASSPTTEISSQINLISVFDVQPRRNSIYQSLGISYEYYVPSVVNRFLYDVHAAASGKNINLILKRKRDVGNMTHSSYRRVVNQLNQETNFREVDTDTSPWALIEKSSAVISIPFTSTALIARHLNKPSIYYDPTGELRNDDPAAHGIPIISKLSDLENWMKQIHENFMMSKSV